MELKDYPVGTRVRIGERTFCRISTGTFWREEDEILGNQVSRPSASLEAMEHQEGLQHEVVELDAVVRERAMFYAALNYGLEGATGGAGLLFLRMWRDGDQAGIAKYFPNFKGPQS